MDNIFKKNFARFGGLGSRSKSFPVHQFITINQKTNYDEIIIFYFLETIEN